MSLHNIDWEIKKAEISYWVRISAQGNQYGCEVVKAITSYAFSVLGLKKLIVLVDDENTPSINTAENSGFTLETRALGLYAKTCCDKLRMGRCYAIFYNSKLDTSGISW